MADTQFMGYRGGFVVCNGDENLLFNYTAASGSPMRVQRSASTVFQIENGGELSISPNTNFATLPALKLSYSAAASYPFLQLYDSNLGAVAANFAAATAGTGYVATITTTVDATSATAAALKVVADTGSATPVNRLFSFGYTDNLDAYQETLYASALGKLYLKNDLLWAASGNIGESAQNRPSNVYAATSVVGGGTAIKENELSIGPTSAITNKSITALQTGTNDPFVRFTVGSGWQFSNNGVDVLDFGTSTITDWDSLYDADQTLTIDGNPLTFTQSATTGIGFVVEKTIANADSPVMKVQATSTTFAQPLFNLTTNGTQEALVVYRNANGTSTTPLATFQNVYAADSYPILKLVSGSGGAKLIDAYLTTTPKFNVDTNGVVALNKIYDVNNGGLTFYHQSDNSTMGFGDSTFTNRTNFSFYVKNGLFQVNNASNKSGNFYAYTAGVLFDCSGHITNTAAGNITTTSGSSFAMTLTGGSSGATLTAVGGHVNVTAPAGRDVVVTATNNASSDIFLSAHGSSIQFNSTAAGETSLDGGLPQNIIGAVNTAYDTAVTSGLTTLDGAYNNFSGAGTVTIDAGDLTWRIQSVYDFVIDDGTNVYLTTDGANTKMYVGSASVRTELGPIDGNIVFTTGVATRGIYAPTAGSLDIEISSATGSGDILITSAGDTKLSGSSVTLYNSVGAATYGVLTGTNSYFKVAGYFQTLADGIAAWPGTASATGIAVDGNALEFINTGSSALLQGVSVKVDGGTGTTILENDKWSMSVGTDGLATITPDSANTQDIVKINNPLADFYGIKITPTGTNTNPAYQRGIYSQGQLYVYGTTATSLTGDYWFGVNCSFSSTGTGLGAGEEVAGFYALLSGDADDAADYYGASVTLGGSKGSGSYSAFVANGGWDYALTGIGRIAHTISGATGWTGNQVILDTQFTSSGISTTNLYGHRIYIGNNAGDSSATYYGLHLSTTSNTAFTKYGIYLDGNWRYGIQSTSGLHVLSRTNGTWSGFGPVLTVQNLNASGDAGPSLYALNSSTAGTAVNVSSNNVGMTLSASSTGIAATAPVNSFVRSNASSTSATSVVTIDNQDADASGGVAAALTVANTYSSTSSKVLELDSAYSSSTEGTRRAITLVSSKTNQREIQMISGTSMNATGSVDWYYYGLWSTQSFSYWDSVNPGTGGDTLHVPLVLPHRSTINSITVWCYFVGTGNATETNRTRVTLFYKRYDQSIAFTNLAQGYFGTGTGNQSLTLSSISAAVDETINHYFLEIRGPIAAGRTTIRFLGGYYSYSIDDLGVAPGY